MILKLILIKEKVKEFFLNNIQVYIDSIEFLCAESKKKYSVNTFTTLKFSAPVSKNSIIRQTVFSCIKN
jgi:hypothetical protein